KEKSPDLDDGGTGLPPRDDDGGGGGGGGGGAILVFFENAFIIPVKNLQMHVWDKECTCKFHTEMSNALSKR
nr:hypothetical protein [Tanacetum cinerariifolium]